MLGCAFAVFVGWVAIWTLISYAIPAIPGPEGLWASFQVDQAHTVYPGRSSPQTAFGLALVASSVVMVQLLSGPAVRWLADAAATLALITAWTSCVGHLSGAVELSGLPDNPATGLAIPTAIAMAAASVGVMLRSGRSSVLGVINSARGGGLLLRIALPVILVLPIAYAALYWVLTVVVGLDSSAVRYVTWVLFSALVGGLCIWFAVVLNGQERLGNLARRRRAAFQLLEARAKVAETEDRFERIFEALPIGLVVVSESGEILQVNPAFCKLFQYADHAIVGKSIEVVVPPQFRERHVQERLEYSKHPATRQMGRDRDLTGIRSDKTSISVEVGLSPTTLQGRRVVIASVIDVTQRVIDEARLDLALAGGTVGLWDWYPDRDELVVSDQLGDLLGRSTPIHSQEQFLQLVHPQDRERVTTEVDRVLASSDAEYTDTIRIRHNDGHYLTVLSRGHIHRNEVGRAVRLLGSITNISEQQRSEDKIRKYAGALEEAYRDLDDFTYIASHDLKAPVRAICSLAEWLLDDTQGVLGADSHRHLELLKSRALRMEHLLDDLLAYCRVGTAHYEMELVHLPQMINDAYDFCGASDTMRLEMDVEVSDITAPAAPLAMCLRNLIDNSVKHHDTQEGTVCVSVRDEGDMVRISVADDGPGIEEAYQEKVFDIFQRLQSRDQIEGSGIGLTILKKTVETYRGEVCLDSAPGRGTTVSMTWFKNGDSERSNGYQDGAHSVGRRR